MKNASPVHVCFCKTSSNSKPFSRIPTWKKINHNDDIQDFVVKEPVSQEVESPLDAELQHLDDLVSEVTHETSTR